MISCTDCSIFALWVYLCIRFVKILIFYTQILKFVCLSVHRTLLIMLSLLFDSQVPITSSSITDKLSLVLICGILTHIPSNWYEKYLQGRQYLALQVILKSNFDNFSWYFSIFDTFTLIIELLDNRI